MKNADMPANPIKGVFYSKETPHHKIGIGQAIKTIDVYAHGLTKREAFAMAAMQGLLSSEMGHVTSKQEISCRSVQHADALLNELSKDQS